MKNEHRPNTGQSRHVRTLDMIDLSPTTVVLARTSREIYL